MKIKKYFTIGGNYIILDADEDSPMIKIQFYNEFETFSEKDKLEILRKILRKKKYS